MSTLPNQKLSQRHVLSPIASLRRWNFHTVLAPQQTFSIRMRVPTTIHAAHNTLNERLSEPNRWRQMESIRAPLGCADEVLPIYWQLGLMTIQPEQPSNGNNGPAQKLATLIAITTATTIINSRIVSAQKSILHRLLSMYLIARGIEKNQHTKRHHVWQCVWLQQSKTLQLSATNTEADACASILWQHIDGKR